MALPVLPIFSEDGGFLTLKVGAKSTSNQNEVWIVFVFMFNFIDNNIIFYFQNLFEMTQNILNEVKHRKVDLEQIKREKEALVKMGKDASEEDTKTLVEFDEVISRHTREIKKFEDWLAEKTTAP